MRGSTSALMPTPVSLTRTIAFGPSRSTVTVTLPPGGVYFAALLSRFSNTCPRRTASPETGSGVPGTRTSRRCPRASMTARLTSAAMPTMLADVEALALERDLPLRHSRHVEQIVDDSGHATRLAGDDLQRTLRLRSRHLTLECGN